MDILKRTRHYPRWTFDARTAGWLVAASLAGLFVYSAASAQSDPSEYQVKAAFLFNFTKFVEWPDGSFENLQAPIVVGIVGDDPFGDDLGRIIAGQKVQGRSLVLQRERWGDDLRRCQVLFVSASEHEQARGFWAAFNLPAS